MPVARNLGGQKGRKSPSFLWMCSETKKSKAIILEKPSYFIHISLAQLNSLVHTVWRACFWNSVEVNTNLSYKAAVIIDKKCPLYDLVVLLPGQCSLCTSTLVSRRRNWERRVLFIEDPNPIIGENDWGWELVITALSYMIVSILIWCFHSSGIYRLHAAIFQLHFWVSH